MMPGVCAIACNGATSSRPDIPVQWFSRHERRPADEINPSDAVIQAGEIRHGGISGIHALGRHASRSWSAHNARTTADAFPAHVLRPTAAWIPDPLADENGDRRQPQ